MARVTDLEESVWYGFGGLCLQLFFRFSFIYVCYVASLFWVLPLLMVCLSCTLCFAGCFGLEVIPSSVPF